MAYGGVVLNNPNELRAETEELVKKMEERGEGESFRRVLDDIRSKVERVEALPKFRNIKLVDCVNRFYKEVVKAVDGKAVKVSYNTVGGFVGESASVTIRAKNMFFKNMGFIEPFKDYIYSIDINDHTDGTFELVFGFSGALVNVKEER